MKSIEKPLKVYIERYAEKYYSRKPDKLTKEEMADMLPIAKWAAFVDITIPDGFGNYTILDFNGYAINKKDNSKTITIPKAIAKRARNLICKYCWNVPWRNIAEKKKQGQKAVQEYLRTRSVMGKRYFDGNNIAIYGESKKPIGRTMLASIVMNEAIKLRHTKHVISHTYDWVDFSHLFREIERSMMDNDHKGGDNDSKDLIGYKTCDWLVVDNIQKKLRSEKQNTLYSDFLDSFFHGRYESELPTILVFKFDIRDKLFDFEKTYGIGLSKMLESDRTIKIPLSEDLLNSNDYE